MVSNSLNVTVGTRVESVQLSVQTQISSAPYLPACESHVTAMSVLVIPPLEPHGSAGALVQHSVASHGSVAHVMPSGVASMALA